MSLSASLIASIVSAIIETIAQGTVVSPEQYNSYVTNRTLPPEAKVGVMLPPLGNGTITVDGNILPLSPVAQFRNQNNLIVMSMSIQQPSDVIYVNNSYGTVHRVWLIDRDEADSMARPTPRNWNEDDRRNQ